MEAIATNPRKTFQQHQPLAEPWSDVRFPEVTLWMTRGLFHHLVAAMVLSWLILITERWGLNTVVIREIHRMKLVMKEMIIRMIRRVGIFCQTFRIYVNVFIRFIFRILNQFLNYIIIK